MKAMILAAGRGSRMGALTEQIPKPLLTVAGIPLIVHHLLRLAQVGITEIVINVSYLAAKIENALGNGAKYSVKIQYSREPTALETGGGIQQALPLLGTAPFLVLSADIWTNYPLEQLIKKMPPSAHLVMVPNAVFHPRGDFGIDAAGHLSMDAQPYYTYGNIGVYHPNFFSNVLNGHCRLVDLLLPRIQQRQLTAEVYKGDWHNIGTEAQLIELRQNLKS